MQGWLKLICFLYWKLNMLYTLLPHSSLIVCSWIIYYAFFCFPYSLIFSLLFPSNWILPLCLSLWNTNSWWHASSPLQIFGSTDGVQVCFFSWRFAQPKNIHLYGVREQGFAAHFAGSDLDSPGDCWRRRELHFPLKDLPVSLAGCWKLSLGLMRMSCWYRSLYFHLQVSVSRWKWHCAVYGGLQACKRRSCQNGTFAFREQVRVIHSCGVA